MRKKLLSIGLIFSLSFSMIGMAFATDPETIYIRGSVWDDTNEDGINDIDEPFMANVTLSLLDSSNNPVNDPATGTAYVVVTNSDGFYSFEGLAAGDYEIQLTLPTGYELSPQFQGSMEMYDSNFEVTDAVATAASLADGDFLDHVDAGIHTASGETSNIYISGSVWDDTNNDGIQDSDEAFVVDATLNLLDSSGSAVNDPATETAYTVLTNSDGGYIFEGLAEGSYEVEFVLPSDNEMSPQDQGSDDTLDSDFEVTNAIATVSNLATGDFMENVDAGIHSTVITEEAAISIYGFVWNDTNKDGIQDTTEVFMPSATLSLLDSSSNIVNNPATGTAYVVVTNSDGFYSFEDLAEGSYEVQLALPSEYELSPQFQSTDDTLDSNFEITNAVATIASLATGDFMAHVDAGISLIDVETTEEDETVEEITEEDVETVIPEGCEEVVYERASEMTIPEDWFSDVNKNNVAYDALISLASQGIVSGSADNHFAFLNKKINRAEATKIISIAREDKVYLGSTCEDQTDLSDVPSTEWFYGFVKNLEALNILSGYPDGSFKPANKINLAETYKVLAISFDLITAAEAEAIAESDNVQWFIPYQDAIVATDVIPKWIPSDLSTEISRGTFFYLLSGLIDYKDAL